MTRAPAVRKKEPAPEIRCRECGLVATGPRCRGCGAKIEAFEDD
jgi:hypothetical protein